MDRRQALRALGASVTTALAGCSALVGSACPAREKPQWVINGERWSPSVKQDYRLLASENYGATGSGLLSRIVCTNTNGQAQWIYNVQHAGAGIPLVSDGRVYVGTGTDHVYSFDFETGHRKWRYDAGGNEEYGGGAWGQPIVVNDSVIVGISHSNRPNPDPTNSDAYIHRVVALDVHDGSEIWTQTVNGMVWAGPVRSDNAVFVATQQGQIYRLNATSGEQVWTAQLGTTIRAQPIADARTVYVVSKEGIVAAFDVESGDREWRSHIAGNAEAVSETETLVLVGDDSGVVTALSKSTGKNRWHCETNTAIAAITGSSDEAWALTQRGFVYSIDTTAGSVTRQFRVAEKHFDDVCGWPSTYERGTGITVDDDAVYVTGPWIGKFTSQE